MQQQTAGLPDHMAHHGGRCACTSTWRLQTRGNKRKFGSVIAALILEMASKFRAFLDHPAGPKTVFFWAPTMKWGLVIAGLADINRHPELISTGTTCALAATGFIWARCGALPRFLALLLTPFFFADATQIIPKNMNLLAVNVFVGCLSAYQLKRKWECVSV